jgi:5,5'-dehydrodivanillate O-demethylase
LFDETGRCIEQPFEEIARPEAHFKDRVRIKAYKVAPAGGMLWVYMGPDPVPELWDWDLYHQVGYKQIIFSHIPCNWLQCAENDIDPVHFEWLHSNWSAAIRGQRDPKAKPIPTHLQIGFDEFEFGFFYRRVLEGDQQWTTGRVALWPNCLMPSGHFEWRVPGDEPFEQDPIPYWWSPIKDEKTGRWINTNTVNQDIIAWVGQGVQSDRQNEHLGESDRGVIMLRKRLMDDIKVVEDGGDPKGVLRDPRRNHRISLRPEAYGYPTPPVEGGPQFAPGRDPARLQDQIEARRRQFAGRGGGPRGTSSFLWYGQPQHIQDEYRRVYEERLAKYGAPERAAVPAGD